jgi:uncharacterized protein YwgA
MFNKDKVKFISLIEATAILNDENKEIVHFKMENRKEISLNDSIIMLLSAIEYNKKVISRTLMQREVFLFYEEILKPLHMSKGAIGAGFFPYKYGPYSIDVNLALSTLIVSGKINITNFYQDSNNKMDLSMDEKKPLNKEKKGKFLTVFTTSEDFNEVASKYEELFAEKGFTLERFRGRVQTMKHAWDQSTVKGIKNLLLREGFREWYNERSLEEVYPSINFGKITEDYRPRVKA